MTHPSATSGASTTDETTFCAWLGRGLVGSCLAYHQGYLASDVDAATSPLLPDDRRKLVSLAGRARWAAERGLVDLVQRRLGPGVYTYLAVLRRRRTVLQRQRSPYRTKRLIPTAEFDHG